jgi:hypothetical protein
VGKGGTFAVHSWNAPTAFAHSTDPGHSPGTAWYWTWHAQHDEIAARIEHTVAVFFRVFGQA